MVDRGGVVLWRPFVDKGRAGSLGRLATDGEVGG